MPASIIFEQKKYLTPPSAAIVILNYNGYEFLRKFMPSVCASSYGNKKIIVADNASSDESISFLRTNYPDTEIIILDKNYGFAEGYNMALQQVDADYFILLNSDVEVTPGWIEPVITLMESDAGIGICQPKLLAYHNKKQFEYAGACGGWMDIFGYPFARGRIFEECETDNGQYNTNAQVFWATGAAMFVKKHVWQEMEGFDGFFFAHQEEIDFCWRAQQAGHKVYCCPESVVYHVGGGTLPKTNHRKTFLNFRNNNIMLLKNLPANQKFLKVPARILLDWVFALKSLLQGDARTFAAIGKAHIAVVKWLFLKKRKRSSAVCVFSEIQGLYRGSIVWEYFIRKKKCFSEIVDN